LKQGTEWRILATSGEMSETRLHTDSAILGSVMGTTAFSDDNFVFVPALGLIGRP